MMNFKPRPVDQDALDNMMLKSFREERSRRVRSVDDEFRDDIPTNLPTGEFSLSDISIHDVINERAFNELGGVRAPINEPFICNHCGAVHLMSIPPEHCFTCGQQTWFGEMVEVGSFRR